MNEYIDNEIFNLEEIIQEDEIIQDIEDTDKFNDLCDSL